MVLIVRDEIRDVVADHVRERWPGEIDVELAIQDRPLGTAHAVLAASSHVSGPFVVINADDLYPPPAYRALHDHLAGSDGTHALASFRVADTLLSARRVSRALCRVDGSRLERIDEGKVEASEDRRLRWTDGDTVVELAGDEPVSMNCWGFQHRALDVFRAAVDRFLAAGVEEGAEVLLPRVVGEHLHEPDGAVTVLPGGGRCLGVTHADDVPLLRAELARPPQ